MREGSRGWWLNLQITLALSGGAVWFAGVAWGQDFLAGVGCGLVVGGLILRLGRRGSPREGEPPDPEREPPVPGREPPVPEREPPR